MNLYQRLKHNYSVRMFYQRARKVSFPHQFVDLEHAKKVGFLININQFTAKDILVLTAFMTKIEDLGIQVFTVELNFNRGTIPMFNGHSSSVFINKEQINWLGFPALSKLQEINKLKCDILLNLDSSEKMTSKFICGLSNARTRVGIFEKGMENFYELMLNFEKGSLKLQPMLKEFENYLKMITK